MDNHLIVIGGTSGIGLSLAQAHFNQGYQVSVIGSNPDKIARLKKQYQNEPYFQIYSFNLLDNEDKVKLLSLLKLTKFNRLIYCAGKYHNERKYELGKEESNIILSINLQCFQEIFSYASEQLKKNETAQDKTLIAISSIAGLLSYPSASLYAQCKRSMISICNTYQKGLKPFNIDVLCMVPGYIDTEQLRAINGNKINNKPFLLSEKDATIKIMKAIEKKEKLYIFPNIIRIIIKLLSFFPESILDWLMKKQYLYQDKKVR